MLGICVDRPDDLPAILVTRYLEYSMSYRYLFSSPRGEHSAERLIDAMVELLVRLHLAGFFWGDCSLSNTLFRPDAGHDGRLPRRRRDRRAAPVAVRGQRALRRRPGRRPASAASCWTCEAGGLLPDDIDPIEMADELRADATRRCGTSSPARRSSPPDEQRYRIAERLRRLNELGFDVDEVELITSDDGCPAAGARPRSPSPATTAASSSG